MLNYKFQIINEEFNKQINQQPNIQINK
jgi:hypothetical protein